MPSPLPVLESIRIATPCTASWDDMEGDDRVRHCASCDLDVYNLSGMTRAEAQVLLMGRTGRTCVRLYRRHDGTVITRDCPTALARMRRRALLAAAAVASVIALFATLAFAAVVRRGGSPSSADVWSSPTVRSLTALFSAKPVVQPTPTPVVRHPPILMGAMEPPVPHVPPPPVAKRGTP